MGNRPPALCNRRSPRRSLLTLVLQLRRFAENKRSHYLCIMHACACIHVCVYAPLPALFIHCFVKGPTCTCMSNARLCVCMQLCMPVCVCGCNLCPTNEAYVLVVFACTNYFIFIYICIIIMHMYTIYIHTCVCSHTVIEMGTSKHMRFLLFAFFASQSILPLIWQTGKETLIKLIP